MFKCDKCDKIFTANHLLKRHIKFVHDKCNIEYVNCNKCDKQFSTKFNLFHHVKNIHDKIKDFKCDKCEYKCSSNCDIIKHKKQVHDKIKDFKCNKCEYVCSDNIKLKSHNILALSPPEWQQQQNHTPGFILLLTNGFFGRICHMIQIGP